MNRYLKNLNKIEFVVTDACTGRCKHCFAGLCQGSGARIDPELAADAVRKISSEYDIKTVMAFGGEPLLHTDATFAVMNAAKELKIPKRQLITNGYFTNDASLISEVAKRLAECGVNDLLISVDAFHQEFIPIDVVKTFAREALRYSIPIRLQPAWLVSVEDDNSYNVKTKEILLEFADLEIATGEGNIVYPEGNALVYLAEYFKDHHPQNPYTDDPCDVKCVSFCANGDVLDGNFYTNDIMDILNGYTPQIF